MGELTSGKYEHLYSSAMMFLDGVFPGEDGGMCQLKAEDLSGLDLLLTLPKVSTILQPPSAPGGGDS